MTCLAVASIGVRCQAADYATLAEAAKADFEPLDEGDLAAARAKLAERVIAAERLLNPTTSFGAHWLEYLDWGGIQKQLAPDTEPDVAAAKKTLRLLGSGAEGLDQPALQRAAEAIEDYIGVAQFAPAAPDRQAKSFAAVVDSLAEQLADTTQLATARGSYDTERRLGLLAGLEATGRGRQMLSRVRGEYGRPNLHVEVQAPLLNRLVARPVNDTAPIADVILGTRIRGSGRTSGSLSVTTLPSSDRARLVFCLTGSTRSNTVGVNGPVQIRSVGDTTFSATKVVELSDQSFRVLPANASATTRSRTQGVSKIGGGLGSRLIERIARKRVAEKKGQADAIAGGRAEGRVERSLDQQLDSQIIAARRRYDDAFTRPLRRRRATPRRLVQQTTSGSLVVEAVQAGDGQLAAWDSPPPSVSAPLTARLHQTAINNLLDAYLGGATLRRDTLDEAPTIDVVAPPWLKLKAEPPAPGEEFKPWSIRLREDRPVSVELAGGRATLLVHAEQIRFDAKTYDDWDVIVRLVPGRIDGRWRLVRQGEIELLPTRFDPASGKRLSSADVGLRENLSDALNKGDRVPELIDIDPIDLSSRGGRVRFLSMAGLRIEDGWLSAGWRAL